MGGEKFTVEEERALAASIYPDMWRNALGMAGKRGNTRRRNIRRWAVEEHLKRPLRAAGATCATCNHRLKDPGSLKGLYCAIGSDFEGYLSTTADSLCSRYDGPRAALSLANGGRASSPSGEGK